MCFPSSVLLPHERRLLKQRNFKSLEGLDILPQAVLLESRHRSPYEKSMDKLDAVRLQKAPRNEGVSYCVPFVSYSVIQFFWCN
ncbi:hypothetical protein E3N88_42766 [Mikania micrantha]|uniref:Uncharacterized protein n=1 Tax=Mikania micrantha TaxID=192012 RepID=A0A5N6LHP5_9ASTR|nr:hypothetical protein E3N88_42766 [Mikania micrantha]